jgi:enamine deaminase RidA (YjgF/YER057c/UK114 family)
MVKTIQSVCAESRRQVNVVLPFSPAIRAGDFVFVSGQVGFGEDMRILAGGIEAEIRQALENIANILALDGSVLERMSSNARCGLTTRAISRRSTRTSRNAFPAEGRRVRPSKAGQ